MKPTDLALWEEFKKTVRPLARRFFARRAESAEPFSPRGRFFHTVRREAALPYQLDLHGFSVQEAYETLRLFLLHHERRGSLYVTVITGRGLLAPGAIKREIALWLDTPFFKERVRAFSWQNGGGAIRLELYQKKGKRK